MPVPRTSPADGSASRAAPRFNFNHRFWLVGDDPGPRQVENSPTLLLGFPLPGRLLVAGQYASHSYFYRDTNNEWEGLLRWKPALAGPVGAALTAAYNGAGKSLDGELSLRVGVGLPDAFPGDSIQVLVEFRGFQDTLGTGEPGWFAGVGLLLHLTPNVALAVDAGTARVRRAGRARRHRPGPRCVGRRAPASHPDHAPHALAPRGQHEDGNAPGVVGGTTDGLGVRVYRAAHVREVPAVR